MRLAANVYVFGDQTLSVDEPLQNLLLVHNVNIRNFLHGSFLALQHEITRLPASEKNSFPNCETLGLLVETTSRAGRHAALESAFTCIYEIAYYIQYVR
jgi:naphtho-gamma-pyrone polyketide synthase